MKAGANCKGLTPLIHIIVVLNGGKITLTEKETSILKYLYRAGGRLVRRNELLDEVWWL